MEKKLNTNYEFTFVDGTKCNMTLAFYKLLQLRSNNKALYERYSKALNNQYKGGYDDIENIVILYTAYSCADNDTKYTEREFFELCGSDRGAVGDAIKGLLNPKKA